MFDQLHKKRVCTPLIRDSQTGTQVESNIVRCPDAAIAERMIAAIDEVRTL